MKKLIELIEQYFTIEEFVSKDVFRKYGDTAWRFFDKELLENLLFIRENIDKPITINNWLRGGNFSQRGLRENTCQIVKSRTDDNKLYLSAHVLGKAVDFDVKGMTAKEVRMWIVENKDRMPHKVRIERKVNWVHMDTACDFDMEIKVYLFNP